MKQIIISIFAAIILPSFLLLPAMGATGSNGVPGGVIAQDANLRSVPVETHYQPMIGVIDIQKVLNESIQGRAAKKRIEQTPDNSLSQKTLSTEEQIIAAIIIEIQAVVESYAHSHGYTHILNKNSGALFYHEMMYDITDDIIQEYDRQMDQNVTDHGVK